MHLDLSIIIINYNGLQFLKDCLESIIDQTKNITYEIIVVDNNSIDESVLYISTNFPMVRIINTKVNNGFGKGNNIGVSVAKGETILLLNNDTILLHNPNEVVDILNSNATIGAIGVQMISNNKKYLHSTGNFPCFWNLLRIKNMIGNNPDIKNGTFNSKSYEVDWLTGAYIMIKKSVYQQINGFDEDYFLYVEDVDFCKRIYNLGYKNLFLPNYKYIHYVGFNSKKNPLLIKGYKLYLKKHHLGINYFYLKLALTINGIIKRTKSYFEK